MCKLLRIGRVISVLFILHPLPPPKQRIRNNFHQCFNFLDCHILTSGACLLLEQPHDGTCITSSPMGLASSWISTMMVLVPRHHQWGLPRPGASPWQFICTFIFITNIFILSSADQNKTPRVIFSNHDFENTKINKVRYRLWKWT